MCLLSDINIFRKKYNWIPYLSYYIRVNDLIILWKVSVVIILQVNEVYNFNQDDLMTEDIFILDCHSDIYVWIGQMVETKNKLNGLNLGEVCFNLVFHYWDAISAYGLLTFEWERMMRKILRDYLIVLSMYSYGGNL